MVHMVKSWLSRSGLLKTLSDMRRLLIGYNASKAVLLNNIAKVSCKKSADANVMHRFYVSTQIYGALVQVLKGQAIIRH